MSVKINNCRAVLSCLVLLILCSIEGVCREVGPSFACSKAKTRLEKDICSHKKNKEIDYYYDQFVNFMKLYSPLSPDYLKKILKEAHKKREVSVEEDDSNREYRIGSLYSYSLNNLLFEWSEKAYLISENQKKLDNFLEFLNRGEAPTKDQILSLPQPFQQIYGIYFKFLPDIPYLHIYRLLHFRGTLSPEPSSEEARFYSIIFIHKLYGVPLPASFVYKIVKDPKMAEVLEEALEAFTDTQQESDGPRINKYAIDLALSKHIPGSPHQGKGALSELVGFRDETRYYRWFELYGTSTCKLLAPRANAKDDAFDPLKELLLQFWRYARRQNYHAYQAGMAEYEEITNKAQSFFLAQGEDANTALRYAKSFMASYLNPRRGYHLEGMDLKYPQTFLESPLIVELTREKPEEASVLKEIEKETDPKRLSYGLKVAIITGMSEKVLDALIQTAIPAERYFCMAIERTQSLTYTQELSFLAMVKVFYRDRGF